jgi:hypothetical protein
LTLTAGPARHCTGPPTVVPPNGGRPPLAALDAGGGCAKLIETSDDG